MIKYITAFIFLLIMIWMGLAFTLCAFFTKATMIECMQQQDIIFATIVFGLGPAAYIASKIKRYF